MTKNIFTIYSDEKEPETPGVLPLVVTVEQLLKVRGQESVKGQGSRVKGQGQGQGQGTVATHQQTPQSDKTKGKIF